MVMLRGKNLHRKNGKLKFKDNAKKIFQCTK